MYFFGYKLYSNIQARTKQKNKKLHLKYTRRCRLRKIIILKVKAMPRFFLMDDLNFYFSRIYKFLQRGPLVVECELRIGSREWANERERERERERGEDEAKEWKKGRRDCKFSGKFA